MKAAVIYKNNTPVEIEEVEIDDPEQGEVLVKNIASGVCHSDLSMMKGYFGYPMPTIPGHEGGGIVEKVGEGVTDVKKGDSVLLTWMPSCGNCYYCNSYTPNLCEKGYSLGGTFGKPRIHKGNIGINHWSFLSTIAEYSLVKQESVVKVSADTPMDKACLIGCGVLTGVGAVLNTAKVEEGSTVSIIGLGGVGLNVVQGCVLANSSKIIGIDIMGWKLKEAERFGITHSINSKEENVSERIKEITDGRGVDYSFEVVGTSETIRMAFDTTRRGGTTVIVGVGKLKEEFSIPIIDMHTGERTIKGSFYGSVNPRTDLQKYLGFYNDSKLKLDELVSKKYSIEQVNEAFEDLEKGKLNRGVIIF